MKIKKYIVVVSSIGAIYAGNNYKTACKNFAIYKRIIRAGNTLSCVGECVTLIANDFIDREYFSPDYNFDN